MVISGDLTLRGGVMVISGDLTLREELWSVILW